MLMRLPYSTVTAPSPQRGSSASVVAIITERTFVVPGLRKSKRDKNVSPRRIPPGRSARGQRPVRAASDSHQQKNNLGQALCGLRITRPSLSQATEFHSSLSTMSILRFHQISSNQYSYSITVSLNMRQCFSTLYESHSQGKTDSLHQ